MRVRRDLLAVSMICVFLLLPAVCPASVYYVANSAACDDSWPGSESQPWCGVQKAAGVVEPGDVVNVKPGDYKELVVIERSGDPGNPITFKSAVHKQALVSRFTIKGSYIKVEGFSVFHPVSAFVAAISSNGDHNEIRNNYCENYSATCFQVYGNNSIIAGNVAVKPQYGILVRGKGNIAENNEVRGLKQWIQGDDCDYSRFFGEDHILRNNKFHGAVQAETGTAHVDCFQTFDVWADLTAVHILIENNYCSDMHQGLMASGQKLHRTRDITVRNNIFKNGWAAGLVVAELKDVYAYNNTFVNIRFHGIGSSKGSSCYIWNNIFYNCGAGYWNVGAGTSGNNLVYCESIQYNRNKFPKDIINVSPLFVDYQKGNFRLKSNSPARDAGATLSGFDHDIEGTKRPQGSAWDIGAFEMPRAIPGPKGLHIVK